jgi:hypothetical protein
LTLSIPLHPSQGGPPPSNLSSRPKRSVGEGPAVSADGETEPRRRLAHGTFAYAESETAGPSPALRFGRDDKLEGGGPPWLGWRWLDRVKQPTRFALFNAFSKLRPPKGRWPVNLDSFDFQPPLRDSNLRGVARTQTRKRREIHSGTQIRVTRAPIVWKIKGEMTFPA